MDRKIIIAISLLVVLSMIIGYIIINVFFDASRGRAGLYVDPETSSGMIGQTFTVNIRLSTPPLQLNSLGAEPSI